MLKEQNKNKKLEIFCVICDDYFVRPVTAKCGHSFCQSCIDEFFLFTKFCPICNQVIRGSLLNLCNTLGQFVQSFIQKNDVQYMKIYRKRIQDFRQFKKGKMLTTLKAGMMVDIRDHNFVWCQGLVIRIISRVGESCKFLKVRYMSSNDEKQQDIKANHQRLAIFGTYTKRQQIPKYEHQLKTLKQKEIKGEK